eukprot:5670299-Prymnesium_polylepis.1
MNSQILKYEARRGSGGALQWFDGHSPSQVVVSSVVSRRLVWQSTWTTFGNQCASYVCTHILGNIGT